MNRDAGQLRRKNKALSLVMLFYNTYISQMNFKRVVKFAHIGLVALMLLAQSAVAQHSADHAWHDSSELCQAFVSAESTSLTTSVSTVLNVNSRPLQNSDLATNQQKSHDCANKLARAPPVIF